jgi:hypothetical protein
MGLFAKPMTLAGANFHKASGVIHCRVLWPFEFTAEKVAASITGAAIAAAR